MDTLTNVNVIVLSLQDTIAITDTTKKVIVHSCPKPTSNEDILLALTIGLIILAGLVIVGHYVCKGLKTIQLKKFDEQKSRQAHEIAKLDKEAEIKAAANEFQAQQTKEQREWLSEADKLRDYYIARHDIRLKEAEVDAEISKLGKNNSLEQENTPS